MRLKIDDLYDRLPNVRCKGKCFVQCCNIKMTKVEWERIKQHLGYTPVAKSIEVCPMLTKDKRCGVYKIRPVICRLYGLVDGHRMRCPHGCVPDWWVDHEEAGRILEQSFLLDKFSSDRKTLGVERVNSVKEESDEQR